MTKHIPLPDSCWRLALDDWTMRPPSRRLRKLYRELAAVEREREAVRLSNPCPEHAPTSCRIKRARLKPLDERLYDVQSRIARLQNE